MNQPQPPLDMREELAPTPYEHVRVLALGGMGEVHVVTHRALREKRVLKVVRDLGDDIADVMAKRMIAEGRLLHGLRHVNIVETLDLGLTKGGKPYVVTELLQGCTLKEEVDLRGPLPAAEVVDILEAILLGIQAAHARGIAHRDLKPLNVFYAGPVGEPHGRCVKIIDFGIAKVLSQGAKERAGSALVATTVGWAIGSPSYMPPEQVVGLAVDSRADLYAIGCIGHFLLTRRPPFGGKNHAEIMANQLTMPPPQLHPAVPGVPETLSSVLAQAMAKSPKDRFESADVMRTVLMAARAELGLAPTLGATQAATPQQTTTAVAVASVAVASVAQAVTPAERAPRGTVRMDAEPPRVSSGADVDTIFQPPQTGDAGDTTPDPKAHARAQGQLDVPARTAAPLTPGPRTQRVPRRDTPASRALLVVILLLTALTIVLACVLFARLL